jgi:hypothetical protein
MSLVIGKQFKCTLAGSAMFLSRSILFVQALDQESPTIATTKKRDAPVTSVSQDQLRNGQLDSEPASQTKERAERPGGILSLSANASKTASTTFWRICAHDLESPPALLSSSHASTVRAASPAR